MKKYLIILLLLLFCRLSIFGQSIKFNDLIYFTSLTNSEVFNALRQGSAFKQEYTEEVNGQQLEYFKNINSKAR